MSPTLTKAQDEGRNELTPEEAAQLAEEQAQQYLGMATEDFERCAASGELPEDNPMVGSTSPLHRRVSSYLPADPSTRLDRRRGKGPANFWFSGRPVSRVCDQAIWLVTPVGGETDTALTNLPVVRLRRSHCSSRGPAVDPSVHCIGMICAGLGERKVSTQHYARHTVGGRGDGLKPQLYSWEWRSLPTHIPPSADLRRSDPQFHGLGKLHIPTGRVFYEDVFNS